VKKAWLAVGRHPIADGDRAEVATAAPAPAAGPAHYNAPLVGGRGVGSRLQGRPARATVPALFPRPAIAAAPRPGKPPSSH